ncbi:UbiH/UbiF family hydroxylase [Chelativorans sp. AA-79]|uniref:UbiH/UbiF family hydroxylase n=1 Tax=Chelativorans sp. AA-79 TaxID=3028735 RepID=UPI0023FA1F71|nr:UbiH/UbiF family hydroxylase [Chelativorans sp. AA-79]WEX07094.1 UbiH/UbiF family hydroxylase [Chelativorans sp. AA-79]
MDTILVAGTGPAGLTAAMALAELGRDVVLAGPPPSSTDRRTSALMRPAVAFLDGFGLGETLKEVAAPLAAMRIIDATNRLIRSPAVTFRAAEIGEESFGLNIPNAELNAALAEKVRENGNITWQEQIVHAWRPAANHVEAELADGTIIRAALAVAADGRNSPARGAAGITIRRRDLHQSALVLNFAHARHHGFASTEFHTEHGPCTQVPLPDGLRSSLVWVMRPWQAEELMALDDAALSERLEERQQSFLGKVTVEPGRQVFPLVSALPMRFAARRIALVGEAAHVFPPITAQGLNLGLRDVMDLAEVVRTHMADPGSTAALLRYDARRRPDILARSGAVNLVNASLLSDLLPAQLLRSAGLSLLGSASGLRGFFMREGMRPGSGFAAILPSILRGA